MPPLDVSNSTPSGLLFLNYAHSPPFSPLSLAGVKCNSTPRAALPRPVHKRSAVVASSGTANRMPDFTTKLFTKEAVSIAGETECVPTSARGAGCGGPLQSVAVTHTCSISAHCGPRHLASDSRTCTCVQVHCSWRPRQVRPATQGVGQHQERRCDRLGLPGPRAVAEHPRHAARLRHEGRQGGHRPASGQQER